jgi:hypothetical protein
LHFHRSYYGEIRGIAGERNEYASYQSVTKRIAWNADDPSTTIRLPGKNFRQFYSLEFYFSAAWMPTGEKIFKG